MPARVDDIGAGFGSFYYLKHLPFDYFKIDGDLIRGFRDNTADQLVIEAIVGIAKGIGKHTVAEFVTDRDMMDRLRRSGIDYAQGFGVGVPQPAVEASSGSLGQHVDALIIVTMVAARAVALGVGLTPEFLPMISAATLMRGALRMARDQVIVKHLPAIQDFGAIDIVCGDKTARSRVA